MRIAVAGTGYVGLVTGVCLAEKGHDVTCVDVDAAKIRMLKDGRAPIYEEGLEELMQRNRDRLNYTTDHRAAYAAAEVVFIGVGTPEKSDGSANLSYVFQVAGEIAASVCSDCVVVVKSTVPIGTNNKVEALLQEHLAGRADLKRPVRIDVVSNPEFLAQGTAVRDTLHAARIVIGANRPEALAVMQRVYADFDAPVVAADRNSAEMIKYASNDFLAVKISYINEIANLCELVGADVNKVAEGMGLDPRIGSCFLRAGIGYGGSCFPKDTKALHWLASMNDYELKTVKAAIEINEQQKLRLIKKMRRMVSSLQGKCVAVLGLTFKPGTDDLREAPSLVNVPLLLEDGAVVRAYDPVGAAAFARHMEAVQVPGRERVTYCDSPQSALDGADACLILTEWPAIKALSASVLIDRMAVPLVLDGRNCFEPEALRTQGVDYHPIGYGL